MKVFSSKEASGKIILLENKQQCGFNIMNIKSEIFQIPKGWKLEPYTIVNLLGKYGNFEVDSNGDGLADGWTEYGTTGITAYALDTGLINSFAQKITTDITSASRLKHNITISENEVLFVIAYIKTTTDGNMTLSLKPRDAENTELTTISTSIAADTNWNKLYLKATMPATTTNCHILIGVTNVTVAGDGWFDGVAVYNLTAMGALPSGLQQYFSPSGVQLWKDLATDSNIEALDGRVQTGEDWLAELLPYVNGIASLGFTWEGI